MESPPVCFAQTVDGLDIAYWRTGGGAPIVLLLPNPGSHLVVEWGIPALAAFYRELAHNFTIVRLDLRGSGLSERRVSRLSPETVVRDIEAVMDGLGIERAGFWGWGFGAMNALQFAEQRPSRAERLVLAETSTGTGGLNRALAELRRQDDDVQIRTRSQLNTGWTDPENAEGLARLIKASMSPGSLTLFWDGLLWSNEERTTPRVEAPVLLLHAVNDPLFPLDEARKLAASLPNASLHLIDSASSIAPYQDRAAIEATKAFLYGDRPSVAALSGSGSWQELSKRELEVLRLIAVGRTNDDIAAALFITTSTVSHHVSNILAKTGAGNRTEAAALAHREHLL